MNRPISALTVTQLKTWLDEAASEEIEAILPRLSQDKRRGVQQLVQKWCRKRAQQLRKEARWQRLLHLENQLRQQGYTAIAGVDEAGRGPLAGPVVAAAVILPEGLSLVELNDSKQLSPALRQRLAAQIKAQAVSYHIAFVHAEEIDRINIYQASKRAMCLAIEGLESEPDYLLTDALPLPIQIDQQALVKGDAQAACIAAASVLAKEARDEWMKKQASKYPEYGFDQHKGYGTKQHWQAIHKYGLTPLHRRSFIKEQLSLALERPTSTL